jgi:hypothetical protein
MDINKLIAGPELDAIVAEKVMGIRMGQCENEELEAADAGMICPKCQACSISKTNLVHDVVPKPYSTNIASAFEVAEKVGLFKNCRHLHEVRVGIQKGLQWTRTGWDWVVEQVLEPLDKNVIISRGETAALAICRAALSLAPEEYQ